MEQRQISLTTAILMNINIMVGGGILVGPGVMAGIAGSASFLAWPLVGLLFLPIVLSTVQLSRMFSAAGGFYAYAKEGLGAKMGFFAGWLYMVGYIFAASLELLALRKTILVIAGDYWPMNSPFIFNVLCLGLVMIINSMSLRLLSGFLSGMTLIKLLPLVVLIVSIPLFLHGGVSLPLAELKMVPFALPLAMFGCFGFEYCTSLSHLIKDSERNAPRAILLGFLITVLIYTLFHFGLLQVMGPEKLSTLGASAFVGSMGIPYAVVSTFLTALIGGASILMLFAGITGITYANSTMLSVFAEYKIVRGSSLFVKLNRAGRPWIAVLLQGITMLSVATFITAVSVLGSVTNLCICASFVLPLISLFVVQGRRHSSRLITLIALMAITGLIIYSWYTLGDTMAMRLVYTIPMALVLLAGYMMYRKPA